MYIKLGQVVHCQNRTKKEKPTQEEYVTINVFLKELCPFLKVSVDDKVLADDH